MHKKLWALMGAHGFFFEETGKRKGERGKGKEAPYHFIGFDNFGKFS